MDELQAQNSKLVHRQCQGDGQGSPQLTVPPVRGHQRQPSYGGEGKNYVYKLYHFIHTYVTKSYIIA